MKITEVQKKNGTIVYRASVYIGVDQITGKKVKTSITARTRKEVKKKAQEKVLEFEKNGSTVQEKPKITNYKELAKLWADTYIPPLKYHTQIKTKGQIKNFLLPAFGEVKLNALSRPIIQRQVTHWANAYNLGQKNGYKDYNSLHALNRRILAFGVALGVLSSNPCHDVIVPKRKASQVAQKHFTDGEVKIFLDYLKTLPPSYKNQYDSMLYRFLLATGLRIGEATALEWTDIDLESGLVTVSKTLQTNRQISSTKTKSGNRQISIDRETILALRLYKNRQRAHFQTIGSPFITTVFSTGLDPYPKRNTLAERLKNHLAAVHLPPLSFHAFRHTHASLLLNAGISYKELQYRLGHSNIGLTLNTYSHLSQNKEKEATTYFEKALQAL